MSKIEKWELDIEHLMACNCNFGCPCSFNAPPTYGTCESALAWRIERGTYSGVDLSDMAWVLSAFWPGALHEKKGYGVVYLDERAKGKTKSALEAIATGKAGGPMSIFMSTVDAGVEIRSAPIEFNVDGKNSWFRIKDEVEVELGPILNPVTGKEHGVSAVYETGGLLADKEDFYSADIFKVRSAPNLQFDYPGRNAILNTHTWHGP